MIKLISGNANLDLSKQVASKLGIELSKTIVRRFSDGEIEVKIIDNVRGADCYIIQSTHPPVNENLMELLVITDALKRASAKEIIAVVPYYGYSRQDRKSESRVPITARLIANLFVAAGITRVITMDLHAGQIQGFFDIPIDNIYALPVILNYFKKKELKDIVIVSPDSGGIERARNFSRYFDAELAIADKRRSRPNEAIVMNIIGKVENKTCIILDDLVDTAGTFTKVAEVIKAKGAKRIFAAASHGILSGNAMQVIHDSHIEELIITDSIPLPRRKYTEKIVVLSIVPILAKVIAMISKNESLNIDLF
ncbi:MAG: ribose-phosphate pyrophosphokinase [Endomicrobium sp.]|nr:ribose-phosphate pyrophosphokinase [Endomicrobium sp.]